jgi:hypothetical protein
LALSEKAVYGIIFAVLAFVGSFGGRVVEGVVHTEDRVRLIAKEAAASAGSDAGRRIVKDEIGPAVQVAVQAAVRAEIAPLAEKTTTHIARDEEAQRHTDGEMALIRGDVESLKARRAGRN